MGTEFTSSVTMLLVQHVCMLRARTMRAEEQVYRLESVRLSLSTHVRARVVVGRRGSVVSENDSETFWTAVSFTS